MRSPAALAAAAGILFVGCLGTVLMRDIIRPLDSLAATARAIAEGDTRIQVTLGERGDEIGDLDDALAKDDAGEIEHAAHAIKGLVGELHAPACREAARALEESGHEKRRAQFADRGAARRREFARLIEALRAERDSTLR